MSRFLLLAAALVCAHAKGAGPPAAAPVLSGQSLSPDPTERVELLDGRRYQGLIETESAAWLNLIEILRPPGRPMYLVIRPIERSQIAATVRLDAGARARLREQIEHFVNRARIEEARMDAVHLADIDQEGIRFHEYHGDWFSLDSTADEPTTRRIIVRMEQVFTAYRQVLPPRVRPERPPRLVVFGSIDEYHAYLARFGLHLENRACFIPKENLLAAGSELALYRAEIAKISAAHQQVRRELEQIESLLPARLAEFGRHLQEAGRSKSECARLLVAEKHKVRQQIEEKQKLLQVYERENSQEFDKVTGQMFTRLYHEAFHAYLENHVYPHRSYDVPTWLNEGLAMTVEEGIVESGTLRLDAPNREALKRLRRSLMEGPAIPLAELLAADQRAFLMTQENGAADSQGYYAAAWGLAYYLTFQQELLVGPRLESYVHPSARGTPPVARFEKLVGMPLSDFEKTYRAYVLGLKM